MIERPTRKLLAKKDSGKAGLYGDEHVVYEKRVDHPTLNPNHQSRDIELVPKDYDATKRSQKEFYGDRAADHQNSRFK